MKDIETKNGKGNSIFITNKVNDSIPYYYHDSLNNIIKIYLLKDKPYSLKINEPTLLFRADRNQQFFVLLPNYNYKIILVEGKRKIVSDSDNDDVNKISNFFINLQDYLGPLRITPFSPIKKAKFSQSELSKYLIKLHEDRNNFLTNYIRNLKDSALIVFLKKNLYWIMMNDYLELYPDDLNFKMTKKIIDTLNDRATDLNLFFYKLCCINSLKNLKGSLIFNDTDYEFIKDNYKEQTRDYLLAALINLFYKNGKSDSYNAIIGKYKIEAPNSPYKFFEIKDNGNKEIVEFNNEIEKVDGENFNLKEMANIINSKLILLDFWASWCLPCVQEFESSKKIMGKYEKRDLQIVFLNMDSDKNSWLQFFSNNKDFMNEFNSYRIIGDFESSMAKKYKISAIPRYILLNSNGEIVSIDAPRPSDPNLITLIDSLLNR